MGSMNALAIVLLHSDRTFDLNRYDVTVCSTYRHCHSDRSQDVVVEYDENAVAAAAAAHDSPSYVAFHGIRYDSFYFDNCMVMDRGPNAVILVVPK